jgi:hypothetical protein
MNVNKRKFFKVIRDSRKTEVDPDDPEPAAEGHIQLEYYSD